MTIVKCSASAGRETVVWQAKWTLGIFPTDVSEKSQEVRRMTRGQTPQPTFSPFTASLQEKIKLSPTADGFCPLSSALARASSPISVLPFSLQQHETSQCGNWWHFGQPMSSGPLREKGTLEGWSGTDWTLERWEFWNKLMGPKCSWVRKGKQMSGSPRRERKCLTATEMWGRRRLRDN